MRFNRRPSRRPLFWALAGILIAATIWALINAGRPQVIGVFPPAEAFAVPAPAPVRIDFDRPMNPDSIVPALRSDPPRTGAFAWEGNSMTFTPDEPWPRGETVTITLETAARGGAGIRLADPYTWSFRTAPTLLAYLWPAAASSSAGADLYALDPLTGDITRLTETDFGVLDFALSPDGLNILLSLPNAFGGADIASLDLLNRSIHILLDCGRELCISPQYDPTGSRIAYANATSRQILILTADGDPVSTGSGFFPAWSAGGLLIAYDPDRAAYFTYDPETRESLTYPNETGEPADWGPDPRFFLAPEIMATGPEAFASHLVRYERFGAASDLTRDPLADDNAPAVSPDGDRVAFARRSLAPESWTPGRQLWVMATDGSQAVQLTAAAVYNHTAFAWSPDGTQIAYVRSNQADLNEPPEIWLITLNGPPAIRLVIGGFAPAWIP